MTQGRIVLVLATLLLSSCMLSGRPDLAANGRRKARLVLDQWRRRVNHQVIPVPVEAANRKRGTLHERAGRLARESDAWLADKAFPFVLKDDGKLFIGAPAWEENQLTRRLSAAAIPFRFKRKPRSTVRPFRKKTARPQAKKKPELKLLPPPKEILESSPGEVKQLKPKVLKASPGEEKQFKPKVVKTSKPE